MKAKRKQTKEQKTIEQLRAQIEARDLTLANIRQHYEAVIRNQEAELQSVANDSADDIERCAAAAQEACRRAKTLHGRIEKTTKALVYRRAELLAEVERTERLIESLAQEAA